MPKYAVAFMIFTMANVGLPALRLRRRSADAARRLPRQHWVALFAATGGHPLGRLRVWLYRRVIFGALEKESLKALLDLSAREKLILYPLVVLTIFFGVYPAPVFDATAASVDQLINNIPPHCRPRRAWLWP